MSSNWISIGLSAGIPLCLYVYDISMFFSPRRASFCCVKYGLLATFMYEFTQNIISISGGKEFASSENEFHISIKLILMVMLALMLMSSPFSLNIIRMSSKRLMYGIISQTPYRKENFSLHIYFNKHSNMCSTVKSS